VVGNDVVAVATTVNVAVVATTAPPTSSESVCDPKLVPAGTVMAIVTGSPFASVVPDATGVVEPLRSTVNAVDAGNDPIVAENVLPMGTSDTGVEMVGASEYVKVIDPSPVWGAVAEAVSPAARNPEPPPPGPASSTPGSVNGGAC
jgi:hypothetical protein